MQKIDSADVIFSIKIEYMYANLTLLGNMDHVVQTRKVNFYMFAFPYSRLRFGHVYNEPFGNRQLNKHRL